MSRRCYLFMHAMAFLALFNVTIVSASRAAFVDISNYPEDWCKGKGSRPTRSTGECICLHRGCIGNCRKEADIVYYVYSECPDCECDNKDNEDKTDNNNGNGYVKTPLSKNTDKKKRYAAIANNYNYNNDYDNNEMESTIAEFIEDNSRIIFATVIVLFLFLLVIPLFTKSKDELLSPQQNQNKEANDNEPIIKSNKND